jgi:hypothetical protein
MTAREACMRWEVQAHAQEQEQERANVLRRAQLASLIEWMIEANVR